MALSPEAQAILDGYENPDEKKTLSPAAQTILQQYPTAASGGAGAFDAQGNPVSNYIIPDGVSLPSNNRYVEPIIGPGKRVHDALIETLSGPYGPADLPPEYTNPLARGAYQAFQRPFQALDYLTRPVRAAGSGLGALTAGALESGGYITPTTANSLQRDLNIGGQTAAIVAGMMPGVYSFMPKAPKAGPTGPLHGQPLPEVGGGYLKDAPVPTAEMYGKPTVRNFDVAADGSVTPAEAPSTTPATVAPVRAIEAPVTAPEAPVTAAPEPSPGMGPRPSESTVGAAQTPAAETETPMSRAEAKARRARDEGVQLEQTDADRRVGGIDPEPYVPGVKRTLGTIDLKHAAEEAAMRDMFPEEFKERDTANNVAMIQHAENGIKDPIAIHNMTVARDLKAAEDLAPMKTNPQPVNLEPVRDLIKQHLDEGASDRGLIKSTLDNVNNTLTDADGKFKTDPNRIYNGIRKNITDMLERGKADPKSNEATAMQHLVEIKEKLDNQIAETNPTFRQYLDNYTAASGPIDEATLLNDIRRRITNPKGDVMLGRVDSVLNDLHTARNIKSGASRALHVSDETMDRLYAIRNELQAVEARNNIATSVGSNTHLRLLQGQKYLAPEVSPARNRLNNMIEGGLHTAAGYVDGGFGLANQAIRYTADKMGRAKAEAAAKAAQAMKDAHEADVKARMQRILNPPPQIGHNGGPPLEPGFNEPPGPQSGGAAATPPELINQYTPTTELAAYHQATRDNALAGQPGIRAFHGSGADHNAFDNRFIGSGEGNQAYGMGHYVAAAEPTAETYLDGATWKYGNTNAQTIYDRLYAPHTERNLDNEGWSKLNAQRGFWERVVLGRSPHSIIQDAMNNPENYGDNEIAYIKSLKPNSFKRKGGHMYEVNIDAHPDHFIDYDKPLKDQSDHVKQALANSPFAGYENNRLPGAQAAWRVIPTTIEDAQALNDLGIKGIKYLDQNSRAGGDDPTHNYVVFDPKNLAIIRKYGIAGLLGGGAAGANPLASRDQ